MLDWYTPGSGCYVVYTRSKDLVREFLKYTLLPASDRVDDIETLDTVEEGWFDYDVPHACKKPLDLYPGDSRVVIGWTDSYRTFRGCSDRGWQPLYLWDSLPKDTFEKLLMGKFQLGVAAPWAPASDVWINRTSRRAWSRYAHNLEGLLQTLLAPWDILANELLDFKGVGDWSSVIVPVITGPRSPVTFKRLATAARNMDGCLQHAEDIALDIVQYLTILPEDNIPTRLRYLKKYDLSNLNPERLADWVYCCRVSRDVAEALLRYWSLESRDYKGDNK